MSAVILTMTGVAVEPPATNAVTQKQVGGMVIAEVKGGLRELKVVHFTRLAYKGILQPHIEVEPGDTVFATSQALASFPWAREVFEYDGQKFIVVPPEFIIGYRARPQ